MLVCVPLYLVHAISTVYTILLYNSVLLVWMARPYLPLTAGAYVKCVKCKSQASVISPLHRFTDMMLEILISEVCYNPYLCFRRDSFCSF